jgi:hypothetical protein
VSSFVLFSTMVNFGGYCSILLAFFAPGNYVDETLS